jgi:ABC-type multidrug transport system ATPase subunit
VLYLPHNLKEFLLPWYSVRKNLDVFAAFGENDSANIDSLISDFGLREYIDEYVYDLSDGFLCRTAIACAYSASADVILIDEVLSTLDIEARALVVKALKEDSMKNGVSAIVVCTHHEDVAKSFANTIMQIGPEGKGLLKWKLD